MLSKRSIISALLTGAGTATSTFALPIAHEVDVERIVNGVQSEPGDFPYFVHYGRCGGALVAPDIVLTAAHCGNMRGDMVIVGAYELNSTAEGAQLRHCDQYIADPMYNIDTNNNDFALCKLDEPVTIDQSFVTLELNEDDAFPAEGMDLLVMGLGATSGMLSGPDDNFPLPDYLQNVTIPAISDESCVELFLSGIQILYPHELTEDTLCAGDIENGRDSCFGDSGGPLVKRTYRGDGTFVDTLVGIVSSGPAFMTETGGIFACFGPGIYSRTSRRAKWIKSTSCLVLNSVASFCDDIKRKPLPSSGAGKHLSIEVSGNDASAIQWSLQDSNGQFVMIRKYSTWQEQMYLDPDECYTWRIYNTASYDASIEVSYKIALNGETITGHDGQFGSSKTETICTSALPEMKSTKAPKKMKKGKHSKA